MGMYEAYGGKGKSIWNEEDMYNSIEEQLEETEVTAKGERKQQKNYSCVKEAKKGEHLNEGI